MRRNKCTILTLLIAFLLAFTSGLQGQDVNPKAIQQYEKAIQSCREDKYELAVKQLNKALEISPHFLDARKLRVNVFESLKKWPSAILDLDTVLMAAPKDQEARYLRAEFYLELGQPQLGIADMDSLLAHPELEMGARAEAQCMKAVLLTRSGMVKEAIHALNMSLKMNPGWGEGHLLRAQLMEQIRDFDNARSDYGLAIQLMSPKGEAYYARALYHLHRQMEAEACADMESALANGYVPEPEDQEDWEELRKACNLMKQKGQD